jgi:regulator of extracellular matrix RemA (YlzA/DUF370 family)
VEVINIGFGNLVKADQIVSFLNANSQPTKRIIQKAKSEERFIDATCGKHGKTAILTNGGFVYLSCLTPETLLKRAGNESET